MSKKFWRINVAVMGLVMIAGCGGSNEKALGPEETVEAFYRVITAGEWVEAEALCDTVSMRDYLDSHKEAWETLSQEDSTVSAIAEQILSGTVLKVEDVRRQDDRRVVTCTLEADGHMKTREATLGKEEGAWRVERISDAN